MRHYEERELIGDEVTKNAIDSRGPLMVQVRKRALFRVNRRTCVHMTSPRMTGAGQHRQNDDMGIGDNDPHPAFDDLHTLVNIQNPIEEP